MSHVKIRQLPFPSIVAVDHSGMTGIHDTKDVPRFARYPRGGEIAAGSTRMGEQDVVIGGTGEAMGNRVVAAGHRPGCPPGFGPGTRATSPSGEQKFDPATAESLALRLATVADPARLNEIGCWIIDCSTGAELLDKTDRKLGYSPVHQPEPFSIVNSTTRAFGDLIRLDRERRAIVETLARIPLGASPDQGGIDEKSLQHLLFRAPEALPIAAIDSAYDGAVPICRELRTRAGPLDALCVNPLGRLTIVEFKLWRNPQARREVIGQILDYAQELASWSYEDLQRAVSTVLNRKGNALYETVRAASGSELNDADFVDNGTRGEWIRTERRRLRRQRHALSLARGVSVADRR